MNYKPKKMLNFGERRWWGQEEAEHGLGDRLGAAAHCGLNKGEAEREN